MIFYFGIANFYKMLEMQYACGWTVWGSNVQTQYDVGSRLLSKLNVIGCLKIGKRLEGWCVYNHTLEFSFTGGFPRIFKFPLYAVAWVSLPCQ